MLKLVSVLQEMIDKYGISPDDFTKIQDAISELENGANEEFVYGEDVAELPIEVGNPEVEA